MTDRASKTPAVPIRVRRPLGDAESDPELGDRPTLTDGLGSPSTPAGSLAEAKVCASLTVLTGDRAGTLIPFDANELVVGRNTDAGLQLADTSLSRRHARFFAVEHQIYVEDLGSTNGTFVSGRRLDTPLALKDGDQIQLGSNRVLRFNLTSASEEDAAVQLYERSVRDSATGAFNRRYFDSRLSAELQFAEQHAASLALLLIDIDQFKSINDSYGHVVGDAVLRVLCASVQRLLKPEDTLVRYGGDELVVLCRATDSRNALILAERIRANIERLPFSAGANEFHVTVSVGVASVRSDALVGSTLLEAADSAMYRAKRAGRNTIAG